MCEPPIMKEAGVWRARRNVAGAAVDCSLRI
jgi:hypothetical protein